MQKIMPPFAGFAAAFLSISSLLIVQAQESSMAQESNATKKKSYSKDAILEKLVEVKSPKDAIRNCKIALDNDLFLQKEFATEAVLLRYFGGKRVEWVIKPTEKRWMAYVSFYSSHKEFHSSRLAGTNNLSVWTALGQVTFFLNSDAKGITKHLRALTSSQRGRFDVEIVRELLGKETTREPWHNYFNWHTEKSHKLGNSKLRYILEKEPNIKEIIFAVNWDGQVFSFNCEIITRSKAG